MLTLLTMTGERQEAFELCQRWMQRQTYSGVVRWVIVDDGREPSPVTIDRSNWLIHVVRPEPLWAPGQNTQARNILAGLNVIGADASVVVIEDDDWYAPDWLETVSVALGKAELVGETCARYYNVAQRKAKTHDNHTHASLCSTALRGGALNTLRSVCRPGIQFIDVLLWQAHSDKHLFSGDGVVGIKGLPGRPGIGVGHDRKFNGKPDPHLKVLRSWIGEDIGAYFSLEKNDEQAAASKQ